MTFLLLTGAGFSYNWGGPLASDVFSALLADKDLDEHTRDLLFDSSGAFEKVLADLHLSTDPDDQRRHEALITAVAGIFYGMNNTFMHVQFEFENPPSVQHSMASFLSRFHAIFTLNQDALLEQHYNPMIGPPMNWGHLQLPGMRFMQPYQPSGARQDKFAVMEPNPRFGTFGTGAQPYVKLHGSVNWSESNMGKRILIMGGQHRALPNPDVVSRRVSQDAAAAFGEADGHRVQLQRHPYQRCRRGRYRRWPEAICR